MEEKFTGNAFQELHNFLVQHNMVWIYLVVASFSLIGTFIGWLLTSRKTSSEISKMKSEMKALESEAKKNQIESQEKIVSIFEKLNSYAEKYKINSKEFQQCLLLFIEKREKNDKVGGREAWRKLNSVFCDNLHEE